MTLLIIAYNIPRFFETCMYTEFDPVTNITHTIHDSSELMRSTVYKIVYENVVYCLFVYLGPLAILIVLNTCLIRELLRARHRLANTQLPSSKPRGVIPGGLTLGRGVGTTTGSGGDQEQNITLVMIVIVIVYLFCQTPAYVNQLLYYVLGEAEYDCGTAYFYFFHVSNIVVSANSSVNFVIYCVFRRQFRQRLVVLCSQRRYWCSCWPEKRGSSSGGAGRRDTTTMTSERSQSVTHYSCVTVVPHF